MQSDLFSSTVTQLDLPGADIRYIEAFIKHPQPYFDALKKDIQWQCDTLTIAGKTLPVPRLSAWYGDKNAHYAYSGITLTPLRWTATLLDLKNQLEHFTHTHFNSVLINLYRDGNDSVAWHSDDEAELGPQPLIASLSLGATRRFSLRGPLEQPKTLHLDLIAGSLLLMAGDTQKNWRHQLAKTKKPVGPRINLTFRQIIPRMGAGL